MWLFIRNIPPGTQKKDLHKFVRQGLSGRWSLFSGSASKKIGRCEIVTLSDRYNFTVERHGLVELDSLKSLQQAIGKLNNTRLNDRVVHVRQYHQRLGQRDKRQYFREVQSDRRANDRRRSELTSSKMSSFRTEAVDTFFRIHN